jgi:hypothetical protein
LAYKFPWNSVYAFSENRVIDGLELEGLEVLEIKFVARMTIAKTHGVISGSIIMDMKGVYFSYGVGGGYGEGNGRQIVLAIELHPTAKSAKDLEGHSFSGGVYGGGIISFEIGGSLNTSNDFNEGYLSGELGIGFGWGAAIFAEYQNTTVSNLVLSWEDFTKVASPGHAVLFDALRSNVENLKALENNLVDLINKEKDVYKDYSNQLEVMENNKSQYSEDDFKRVRTARNESYKKIKKLRENKNFIKEIREKIVENTPLKD